MKLKTRSFLVVLIATCPVAAHCQMSAALAAAANLVRNGKFENHKNTWMDTNCNYMSLTADSTVIPGWTVTPGTTNEIVWAKSVTCDDHTAAAGMFFLDLTGFGADSPNGGVQQTITGLTVGQEYAFRRTLIWSLKTSRPGKKSTSLTT